MKTPYALRTEEQKQMARSASQRFRDKNRPAYNKQSADARREKYRIDEIYREKCKAASRAVMPRVQREYRARLRDEVFDHYGRVCACCGETGALFLTLGHVNGDGAEHRHRINGGKRGSRRAGASTARIYLDVIRRGFPADFRIECYNCNCGAFRNGGVCPHVKLKEAPLLTTEPADTVALPQS